MTTTPDMVVAAARRLLGVRFVHQGRSALHGVDCAGVVVLTARALGLTAFDVAGYPRRAPVGQPLLRALVDAGCKPVTLQAGAVLLMSFVGQPQHLGILTPYPLGGLGLLHAYSVVGEVIEHRYDSRWLRRTLSAWALPGVEHRSAVAA